jgi:hypothetical protein
MTLHMTRFWDQCHIPERTFGIEYPSDAQEPYPLWTTKLVVIHIKKSLIQVRWDWKGDDGQRFYNIYQNDDIHLKTLLLIGERIPVGVYADALEDAEPHLTEVANFLRTWEQLERERR